MELYLKVRLARSEGMSQRELARHFNISRDSIRKMLAFSSPPGYRRTKEIEEKVLHLRSKYHLGPMRIVWYLARYHGIKISDATVSRILRRHGVNRLPRGTRVRKVHTKRYGRSYNQPRKCPATSSSLQLPFQV